MLLSAGYTRPVRAKSRRHVGGQPGNYTLYANGKAVSILHHCDEEARAVAKMLKEGGSASDVIVKGNCKHTRFFIESVELAQ
jgi:hypothetical protein